MSILEVTNLTKKYDDFSAVDQINFTVEKGEIFGFLGPNGAGKTTTINMLTGLAKPTSGSILLFDIDGVKDIKKVQQVIGIVPDESNLYDELTGFENLVFCASLYGIDRQTSEKKANELLKLFGLDSAGKKLFKAYSKGMKRKLTIAAGIIHQPEILFLDEPTTGIDVENAKKIRELIINLNENGTTVFLTTHYIEEAERLCHKIGFIVEGKIIKIGTLEELMKNIQREHIVQFVFESGAYNIKNSLENSFNSYKFQIIDDKVIRVVSTGQINLIPFISFFEENQMKLYEAKIIRPSLEDVFVKITGIGLDKMKKEKGGDKK